MPLEALNCTRAILLLVLLLLLLLVSVLLRLLLQLLQLLLPLLLLLLLPLRLPAQQCLHRHCCADIAVQALQCSHFGPLVCPHPGPGVALAVLSRDARGTLAGRACAGVPVQACLCRRACAGVPVQACLCRRSLQAFLRRNACRHSCTGMFAGTPVQECLQAFLQRNAWRAFL